MPNVRLGISNAKSSHALVVSELDEETKRHSHFLSAIWVFLGYLPLPKIM